MVVVLSEDSFVDPNTIDGRELRATVDAARMFGCRVYPIPLDFEVCETAENALAYLPEFDPPVPGICAGYIPAVERYDAIYQAAAAKGDALSPWPGGAATRYCSAHSRARTNEMSNVYDIGVLPGDGIGEEVVTAALGVLDAAQEVFGFRTPHSEFAHSERSYSVDPVEVGQKECFEVRSVRHLPARGADACELRI